MENIMGKSILAAVMCFAVVAVATAQETTEPPQPLDTNQDGEIDKLEATQQKLTNLVRSTAGGIDNFFSDERHSWQNNKTRITVRANADYVDDHGWEVRPEVRINLALPGMNLRIVANDDEDDGAADGGSSDEKESNLALRWVGKTTKKYGFTFDLGVSTRGDPSLQGFVRGNLYHNWKLSSTWDGRLENRLYYYTNSELRNDFRWYFEHRINDKFFFRSRTRLDYQQDKDKGVYPEQRFTLFHQISNRSALAYELIAEEIYFDDSPWDVDEIQEPDGRYTQFQARLRFRQNIGYPWLFYEVWPIAAWAEEQDYKFTLAIRLRLEVVLGDPPSKTQLGMN
jgi:hypothetical protein